MIRILIADDQKLLRESLRNIVEMDGEISVAGCAANGFEALELCEKLQPDLVLMDIKMPECDGVEGTRLIKEKYGNIKVIILTTFEDDSSISSAIENGADGYIVKDVTPEELIYIIKNSAMGFCVMSKKSYDVVTGRFNAKRETARKAALLNENEMAILRCIADGKTNREIAAGLFLSEGRVKNIITELLEKLGVKDRYQLLSVAYKNDLLK